jgi:hypothetical protein
VQIGGGVRVGDAFQAIVGYDLIAIWGMWFCVEISQSGASVPRSRRTREIRTGLPTALPGSEASGRVKTDG